MNHSNGSACAREGKNMKYNKNYVRNERDGDTLYGQMGEDRRY